MARFVGVGPTVVRGSPSHWGLTYLRIAVCAPPDKPDTMPADIDEWEASVADVWEESDSLSRDEAVAAMQELADACPAGDGRGAFELAVQYGSTLRNFGRLDEAIAVLSAAPTHESTGAAPRVVLALALHSAGRKDEPLRVAVEAQIDAMPQYQRSMRNYAAALTEPATPADPSAP